MARQVRIVAATQVCIFILGLAHVALGQSYLLPGTIYDQEKNFLGTHEWGNYYFDPGNVGYQPGDKIDNTIETYGGVPDGWHFAADDSCWMASASDMLRYIGGPDKYQYWAYDHGVETGIAPSPRYWTHGGYQEMALGYAGYYTNQAHALNDDGSINGLWSDPSGLIHTIASTISDALPVGIGIFNDSGMKHAITVVGINTNQQTMTVTDSDDALHGPQTYHYAIVGNEVQLTDYGGGAAIYSYCTFMTLDWLGAGTGNNVGTTSGSTTLWSSFDNWKANDFTITRIKFSAPGLVQADTTASGLKLILEDGLTTVNVVSGGSLTWEMMQNSGATINLTGGSLRINQDFINSGAVTIASNSTFSANRMYMGSALVGAGGVYQTGGSATLGTLVLGQDAGTSGSYWNTVYGNFTADNVVVGRQSDATFMFSAGAATVNTRMTFGEGAGVNGEGIQNGGVLSVADMVVGGAGNGTFSQYGGLLRDITGALTLGDQSGSTGNYSLYSSGSIYSVNALNIGYSGTGTFTQYAYTSNDQTSITLACRPGGKGYYNMYGGELSANTLVVGANGDDAAFDQEDGTVTIAQSLTIADGAGSQGVYKLNGGSLSVNNVYVGNNGVGSFNQTQGTLNVAGSLVVGNASGVAGHYLVSGGNVATNTLAVGGLSIFDHNAGSVAVADSVTLTGSSQYNLRGGSLSALNENIADMGSSTSTFLQTGGLNTVSDRLTIFGGDVFYRGTYEIDDGTLQAAGGIGINGGEFNVFGGATSAGSIILWQGGYLHWTGGSLAAPLVGIWGGTMAVEQDWAYDGSLELTAGMLDLGSHTLTLNSTTTPEANGSLTTGKIVANNVNIGTTGQATFTQMSGSLYATGTVRLGDGLGSSGTYNFCSGSLLVGELDIGSFRGEGIMNWVAGSLAAATVNVWQRGHMTVANDWTYDGTLDIYGGKLDLGSHTLTLDRMTAGPKGYELRVASGSVDGRAGQPAVAASSIDPRFSGASATLSDGQLLAGNTIVGEAGQARFMQSGGIYTLTDTLTIGKESSAVGMYTMAGGSLAANALQVGVDGGGTFTQYLGSTVTIGDGGLKIAGNTSAYCLMGGLLTVNGNATVASGTWGTRQMIQSGGTANFNRGLTIGSPLAANGATYELSGGTANVTGDVTCYDDGHLLLDGTKGVMNVSDTLRLIGGSLDVVLSGDSHNSYIVANGMSLAATAMGGPTFSLSLADGYSLGDSPQTWMLVDLTDPTASISGSFAGMSDGSTFTFGSEVLMLSYHGGDGNDLVLTTITVPEPGTMLLLIVGMVGGLAETWRRRSKGVK